MPIETCADLGAFFRAELSEALRQRRARLEPETSDYLVELLAQCATTSGGALLEGSLVLRLDEALAQAPTGRLGALVGVGDAALCRSGSFARGRRRPLAASGCASRSVAMRTARPSPWPGRHTALRPLPSTSWANGFRR